MRILLVTDAWFPQVSGVVRTLDTLKRGLDALGHDVCYLTPDGFRSMPCPTYPEIRLALASPGRIAAVVESFAPNAIHIATEGPLGWLARRHCWCRGYPFTTAFHTRFPNYVHARWHIPTRLTYGILRRFHAPSSGVMVATASIEADLRAHGFARTKRWTRGVDVDLYRPRTKNFLPFRRPIFLFCGRVAIEKNIEAFLGLDLDGTKVVVGDGPQRAELAARFSEVRFVGAKFGEELARHYAAADVFVFPSRTDTFGLVLLEALASGVPVAAYPVPGPLDVIGGSPVGCLDKDLGAAARRALAIPGEACRAFAETFSWARSVGQFLGNLHVFR